MLVFCYWPAVQAMFQSLTISDPFGTRVIFVGLENFQALFASKEYWSSMRITVLFTTSAMFLSLASGFLMAVFADRAIRGIQTSRILLIWPYAVAPVVAGVLWMFMFDPMFGSIALLLKALGVPWNPTLNGTHAMIMVIIAASWKQFSYNFVFFLAGLQAIPRSLIEAAAIDGAGPATRVVKIIFPLLSPTTFFLLVMNLVFMFFDTFGVIHSMTQGGPGNSTNILVYKVYNDGFLSQDLGSSSAQSVILMIIVMTLTVIQFRYLERKVVYG